MALRTFSRRQVCLQSLYISLRYEPGHSGGRKPKHHSFVYFLIFNTFLDYVMYGTYFCRLFGKVPQ